jgi:glycosyltransferase involved in cell wall biosynthesis
MSPLNNNRLKNRRILMIAPTPFFADRGCHVRISGEARALIALGYDLVLCTYGLGRDVAGIPTQRAVTIPWYKKLSAGPSFHKFYVDLLLLWKVIRVCRRFQPDIIHAHLHEGIVIGKIASLLFRIPMVADLQGSLTSELLEHKFIPNVKWLVNLMYWLERQINRMPSHLIVSCSPTAQKCIDFFGISTQRVSSILDGVDADIFSPQAKDPVLQAALGILPEQDSEPDSHLYRRTH